VNLSLEVLGKREDGYHELVTVLQSIDLSDQLILEDAVTAELKTTNEKLPEDEGNLVWQAVTLLRDAAGITRGARITLDKRIPIAAGLGGGSSDAAATLWGLNRLWGLRWSTKRLSELAVLLGMDVPFFLQGGRTLATGRGELLQPLPSVRGLALVLANPSFPLSTREVYGRVPQTLQGDGSRTQALIMALATGNSSSVAASLYNNLEPVVESLCPAVSSMKRALVEAGALGAVMSGSGPTVLGVARSYDHARQIRNRVARASWSCWAVRTLSGPAIRIVRWGVAKR
jgi:4-diphosphocytidyl-2-C-methyl-D-erythritol kinase